jgi:hypothetical protein
VLFIEPVAKLSVLQQQPLENRSFVARRAKNCKQPKAASLCIEPAVRTNRVLQQAL